MDLQQAKDRFPRKDPKKGLYLTVTEKWFNAVETEAKRLGVRPSFLARELFARGASEYGLAPETVPASAGEAGDLFDDEESNNDEDLF